MKDLYTENYKALVKEIEIETRKQTDIPCSLTGRINILILAKGIYIFNTIHMKFSKLFLKEI